MYVGVHTFYVCCMLVHCKSGGSSLTTKVYTFLYTIQMAAESEVSFSDDLDGSTIRVGVLRTRWNDEHVSNLVDGIKVSLLVLLLIV